MNSPFNSAKYNALLEGLEAAEVSLSALYGTATMRLDPEYFKKVHLRDESHIALAPGRFQKFSDIGLAVDGSAFYPAIEEYYGSGELPFLRVGDVDTMIDYGRCTRIPAEVCDRFKTLKRVAAGDILLTKGGSVGRVGLVTCDAAACRDLIFINSSKLAEEDRTFLYIYFLTGFCNRLLIRSSSQTAQPHLTITLIRELSILKASKEMKRICLSLVQTAFAAADDAAKLYAAAQDLLLSELGLSGHGPPAEKGSVMTFSASFGATGRLDSEYYQPKYNEITQAIKGYKQGCLTLSDLIEDYSTGFPYKSDDYIEDGDVYLVRINNIANGELDLSSAATLSNKIAQQSPKDVVNVGDILISMSGTIGRACCITDRINAVVNQRILRITPKNMNDQVLTLFLNSQAGYLQFEQMGTGGVQTNISSSDMKNVLVPNFEVHMQSRIRQERDRSLALRRKSAALLEYAKQAVEMAIEQDEETAMQWLADIICVEDAVPKDADMEPQLVSAPAS